jgi:membrane protein
MVNNVHSQAQVHCDDLAVRDGQQAGAIAAAVIWQALQLAGAVLLGHKLKGATATYGLFGLVLGLLAWIYLGAVRTVICAEYNAVRARQPWPRSLLTPFTGNVELTSADQRACTSYAYGFAAPAG